MTTLKTLFATSSKMTKSSVLLSFLMVWASRVISAHHTSTSSSPSFTLFDDNTVNIAKRGIVSPTNEELLRDSLGFATIPVISLVLRSINKIFVTKAVHVEDLCMLVAMSFYIALLILINVSAHYATNLYPVEETSRIFADPKEVADRIFGSKIVVGLEQSMMAVTWLVKLCIWFFLKRVCANIRNYKIALYALLIYITLGFFIVEIAYYVILCQPFSQYWAMPVQNSECTTYHKYSVIQMVLNISSDLFLFFLPTWIVLRSKMLPRQRIICLVPFSLALITIIFAILNKYYNFASPNTTTYQLWYVRESSMAIGVANLICSWQLFKTVFHMASLPSFKPGYDGPVSPLPLNSHLTTIENRGAHYSTDTGFE
ncbi:hypothetical protein GcC1_067022 [Golovinomyces cichoracearum]|uniref:Rhodopsin domain-containing protein n=1 Tax=Golovinomyces cichoracearum TaxID=62708 RepID=A0A420IR91_9PEZI|nr:hypothetical protein GcC1_067022 [Golovinomyces cichoracearum]